MQDSSTKPWGEKGKAISRESEAFVTDLEMNTGSGYMTGKTK